ncbi:MAG: histidine--tRNA ligase [Alphaproteobacteria bacterium]|nr:histidine--tRNA ligase [Alphaproteobacteria bacterium]
MATLQPVRGTHDLLPDDTRRFRHVVETGRQSAERAGYDEIATPIFEFSEVFKRTLGDTSDIVTKEMYSFTDKGGDDITLRPEGTAGVVRAVISGGLAQHVPLKYFYAGPMFRYERPQKGRQRQFHQIGVELIGVGEPLGDVEVIGLGAATLDALGIGARCTLEINSLGNAASRAAYRTRLVTYLGDHRAALSDDSRVRLERNPLRVLDSKDPRDRQIVAGAPVLVDSLDPESAEFFAAVRAGLDALGIAYRVNPHIVRGLDYYCHTAFEFTTEALGAQGTVLAGGRYDGLVQQMGGPAIPGVGWAAGIERLAMLVADTPPARRPVAVVPVGEAAEREALRIAARLRAAGLRVDLGYRGNLARRMKQANRVNAAHAVILGDDEIAAGAATVRDLDSGTQARVALADLAAHLLKP